MLEPRRLSARTVVDALAAAATVVPQPSRRVGRRVLGLVRDAGLAWVGPVVTEGLEDVVAGDGGAGLRAERVDATAVAANRVPTRGSERFRCQREQNRKKKDCRVALAASYPQARTM